MNASPTKTPKLTPAEAAALPSDQAETWFAEYARGLCACHKGDHWEACPHAVGSLTRGGWIAGWISAGAS